MSERNISVSTPSGVLAVIVFFAFLDGCMGPRIDCAIGVRAACEAREKAWQPKSTQEPTR